MSNSRQTRRGSSASFDFNFLKTNCDCNRPSAVSQPLRRTLLTPIQSTLPHFRDGLMVGASVRGRNAASPAWGLVVEDQVGAGGLPSDQAYAAFAPGESCRPSLTEFGRLARATSTCGSGGSSALRKTGRGSIPSMADLIEQY